jgi:hypothetical protein
MKKIITLITLFVSVCCAQINAQTVLKPYKVGHEFTLNLPDYMKKTLGLNEAAVIQFKNEEKDVYGFIIEDNKEELALAESVFATIDDFYNYFIKDFLVGQEKRVISKTTKTTKTGINFMQADASYFDKDANVDIYYYIGIVVETKTSYYKLLCFTSLTSKDKFKADFDKILYSIKD